MVGEEKEEEEEEGRKRATETFFWGGKRKKEGGGGRGRGYVSSCVRGDGIHPSEKYPAKKDTVI